MAKPHPMDTQDYRALFLTDTPLIDTRAPVEFARGAFPGAVNLPLMSDEERAQVGTCYKERGQSAAIQLGHELVSGTVKERRIQAWVEFTQRHPEGYLYCFRGGMRSKICQQWLAEAGCRYPRVLGGYKAMRRFLLDTLEVICQRRHFLLLAGRTGAAKTEWLNRLPNSVDLEGHARHRGSAFGRRVGGQPTPIDFENALIIDLLRRDQAQPHGPLVLEDEGHFIGRCTLPLPLQKAMDRSPLLVMEVELETRVEHSFKNYILDNLADWQAQEGMDQGFEFFAEDLRASLGRVRRRLGGARYQRLSGLLETALAAHRAGDNHRHRDWIRALLQEYYDPMYDYQLRKRAQRVLFRGSAEEVMRYIATYTPEG